LGPDQRGRTLAQLVDAEVGVSEDAAQRATLELLVQRHDQEGPTRVAKLRSPRDTLTFIVFTSEGSEWTINGTLFYEPRARISGGGARASYCCRSAEMAARGVRRWLGS
jgi:hypothetical protein